ncbi:hypothetical protein GCM10007304_18090 [Rhodococcoides trifolii]|uniref:Uncharacterized protein n=1 Tax=Rhodococcoides trifolii TaxID=908250 RepID=A0A917D052_9NOCA|nr:hypothetical protein [Rhodococcus trifolii]GGG04356.1 hypothetical protein GCM10007304_18090 [Rhodococcus trifolii]
MTFYIVCGLIILAGVIGVIRAATDDTADKLAGLDPTAYEHFLLTQED